MLMVLLVCNALVGLLLQCIPPGRVFWLVGRWAVVLLSCLLARLLACLLVYGKSVERVNPRQNFAV